MKRIIGVFIAFYLTFFTFVGYTEDVKTLTDEELSELYQVVLQEIIDRGIEKTAHLQAGRYIGGKDIPVGGYLLFIDNRDGDKDVFTKIQLWGDPYTSCTGSVKIGDTFQIYVEINNKDMITIEGDFYLTIKPRGQIVFE